jgi:hypothetical protein
MHLAALYRSNAALAQACHRVFGSYRKALEAAGMDYQQVQARPSRVWTQPHIIAALRKAANDRHPMWWSAMKRANPALVRAAQRYFGTYERAAEAAGLATASIKPPRFRKWAPARVILELQRLHKRPKHLKPAELVKHRPSFYRLFRKPSG